MTHWLVALFLAVVVVEVCLKIFRGNWIKGRLKSLRLSFQSFLQAQNDDERQLLLLRTGYATLRFSLQLFGLMFILAAIVLFPPWALSWSATQESEYVWAMTISGTLWWLVRTIWENGSFYRL